MKKKIAFLLFIISNLINAQETVYAPYIEPESKFVELKKQLRNGDYQISQIENSFIDWDYKKLRSFLDKKIKKKVRYFLKSEKNKDWNKRTHYYDYQTQPFELNSNGNILELKQKNNIYNILYCEYNYYVKDSTITIHSLSLDNSSSNINFDIELPKHNKISNLEIKISESLRNKNTKKLNSLLEKSEKLELNQSKVNFSKENDFRRNLANNYGSLSWLLIFEKKYKEAIEASEKGLSINKNESWIYTNLALSNLCAGNIKIAEDIYNNYKNQKTNHKKVFKKIFKADLKKAKEAKLLSLKLYDEMFKIIDK